MQRATEHQVREYIQGTLQAWSESLCQKIEVAGLLARSEKAHKWKVTNQLFILREATQWRIYTLANQAYNLASRGMILGSMILLRATIESLAALIYINRKMSALMDGRLSFKEFQGIVSRLHLGDSTNEDSHQPIRVGKMIELAEKETHSGIDKAYENLCQFAHPNFDGVAVGFSKPNPKEYETTFGDFFQEKFGVRHLNDLATTLKICDAQYNEVWPKNLEALEKWLETNDERLERESRAEEATKASAQPTES